MAYNAPSAEELEQQGGDFKPLPEDRYIVRVVSLKRTTGTDIFNKSEEFPEGPTFPQLDVVLDVESFDDGSPLVDIDEVPIPADRDPQFRDWLNLDRIGMKPEVARTRQFIQHCRSVPLGDAIVVQDWNDLVGARLIAAVKVTDKGRNRVKSYEPIKKRRGKAAAPATVTPPTIPGEKVAKAEQPVEAEAAEDPQEAAEGLLATGATF